MDRFFFVLCVLSVVVLAQTREGRIIGGDLAQASQFPYQVSLQADSNQLGYEHVCGGGIISERLVLTAAHCIVNYEHQLLYTDYVVVAGATDLKNPGHVLPIGVEEFYVPKSYTSQGKRNDIAIIKLSQEMNLRKNGLRELDLPRSGDSYVGKVAKIAGYGWNWIPIYHVPETGEEWEGTGESDGKLRYLNVKMISNAECHKKNNKSIITESKICGHAVQRFIDRKIEGICTGESGGPLVIDNTVIGVVSTSPRGCKEDQKAGMYTRVSSFLKFVNNVMDGVSDIDHMFVYNTKGINPI